MTWSRVAIYKFKPGTVDGVVQKAQQELLPVLQHQPGYIAYQVQKAGEPDQAISISAWQSQQDAEAATTFIERWVRDNIADTVVSVQQYISNIAFSDDRSLIV
jgi:heme-degrading monooxygenase HmoA